MAYDETLVQEETLVVQVKRVRLREGQAALVHDGQEVRLSVDGPCEVMVPAEYTVGVGTRPEVMQAIASKALSLKPVAIDAGEIDVPLGDEPTVEPEQADTTRHQ
jgi:hypothetical protein